MLQLARQNCPAAIATLWRVHYGPLCRSAARITARFEPEDLAAEAFANLLEALRAGQGPVTAAGPYLRAIVRNLSIRWTRRIELTYADSELDLLPDPSDSFAIVDEAGERALAAAAYQSLSESWRRVLWLSDVEGLSASDISSILGLAPNAVSQLRWRAVNGLRKAHAAQRREQATAAA